MILHLLSWSTIEQGKSVFCSLMLAGALLFTSLPAFSEWETVPFDFVSGLELDVALTEMPVRCSQFPSGVTRSAAKAFDVLEPGDMVSISIRELNTGEGNGSLNRVGIAYVPEKPNVAAFAVKFIDCHKVSQLQMRAEASGEVQVFTHQWSKTTFENESPLEQVRFYLEVDPNAGDPARSIHGEIQRRMF